jgi:uncharacterized spore protein YtfJ
MSVRDTERLIATTLHSGNKFMDYGTVTGTAITFAHKFVSVPIVIVTPLAATGTPTATVVSKNQDANGYYTGATLVTANCTSVDWIAIGTGIGV